MQRSMVRYENLTCYLLVVATVVEFVVHAILIVDGVGCLLSSRKLVWFTDDGICGEGFMICT